MPDLDGFGVLEALGADVPRGVVFVTAHDEHAIRAFDVHALDYILKPFGRPRFNAAVTRALERLSALDALTLQRTLASMADDRRTAGTQAGELALGEASKDEPRQSPPRRIGVRTGSKTLIVDVDNVDWVEASATTRAFTPASRRISSRSACTRSSGCSRPASSFAFIVR